VLITSILSQVIYFFSGSNGVFIFNSLDEFYSAANESIALNGAPSVKQLCKNSGLFCCSRVDPFQILKSDKIDLYFQDDFKVNQLKVTMGIRATGVSFKTLH
jgi:hypothetical protein